MDDLEKLGVRVRTLRKLNRYTQEQLSVKIDRAVSAVSALECGVPRPKFETLIRLSEALEVSLSDLFDFEGCRDESHRDDILRVAYLTTLTTLARNMNTAELGWATEVIRSMSRPRQEIRPERRRGRDA